MKQLIVLAFYKVYYSVFLFAEELCQLLDYIVKKDVKIVFIVVSVFCYYTNMIFFNVSDVPYDVRDFAASFEFKIYCADVKFKMS